MAKQPRHVPAAHTDEREHRRQLSDQGNELAQLARSLEERIEQLEARADELENDIDDLTERVDEVEFDVWSWTFPAPEDGEVRYILNLAGKRQVLSVTTVSDAGTADVTGKIDGTPLGGSANSVSTTEETQTHSSANVIDAGGVFSIEFDNVAAAENVTVTVVTQRIQ